MNKVRMNKARMNKAGTVIVSALDFTNPVILNLTLQALSF